MLLLDQLFCLLLRFHLFRVVRVLLRNLGVLFGDATLLRAELFVTNVVYLHQAFLLKNKFFSLLVCGLKRVAVVS